MIFKIFALSSQGQPLKDIFAWSLLLGLLVINFQLLGKRFNLGSEVSNGDWKVFTSFNLVKNKPRRINECVRSFEGEEMGKMAFR